MSGLEVGVGGRGSRSELYTMSVCVLNSNSISHGLKSILHG